jgi:hypothetical protein
VPKIKIDATTIALEVSDAATHRAKVIGPQAIAAITNVEKTTVRCVIVEMLIAAIAIALQASDATANDKTTTVQ